MEAGWAAGASGGWLSDWSVKMPNRFFCGVVAVLAGSSFDCEPLRMEGRKEGQRCQPLQTLLSQNRV